MKIKFQTILILLTIASYANAWYLYTTFGRDIFDASDQIKIQSKDETAAVVSVSGNGIKKQTEVTIELVPTRDRDRMEHWNSTNTYIVVDSNLELPLLGERLHNDHIVPEGGAIWYWENAKKGEKYRYKLVFDGEIPPGVKNVKLIDKGTANGSHGYSFDIYNLDNPCQEFTSWSEISIKQSADSINDGICGIYEGSDDTSYKLGCVKQYGEYRLIYLGSREHMSWWQVGDIKAVLRPSATKGLFKADWYMADKTLESNSYVIFDGGSMKTIINSDETFYLKMYPNSTGSKLSTEYEEWTGTGFALNNGYIATNLVYRSKWVLKTLAAPMDKGL